MFELRLPRVSYRVFNDFAIQPLTLEQPFRITFDGWGPGNYLHDWYNRQENPYIQTMQLRKERESPFFHECIVIRLKSDTYWRIARRQGIESTPLDCLYNEHVSAHDTVEQVTSLESVYSRSDCLIELEFKENVHIGLVLRICRAIQNHQGARFYTVQRYNCYFFAQTVLFCTACGVSDWAGVGEPQTWQSEGRSPWKTPNAAVPDFSKDQDLENVVRLMSYKWNPTDRFGHDWDQLSRLSNPLINAIPLLRHADSCNKCLQSQVKHRQRSLTSEINRLKQELTDFWDSVYCEVLNKVYTTNQRRLVNSGVWGVVYMFRELAAEDSKQVMVDNLDAIRSKWERYSKERVEKLIELLYDIIDSTELCDTWSPAFEEWQATRARTCNDGSPIKLATSDWEKGIRAFFKSKLSELEAALEEQTIRVGTEAQEAAMRARLDSFTRSMSIKIRVAPLEGDLILPEGAAPTADQQSIFSGKIKRSMKTMKARATKFKNKKRRPFGNSHKMEDADITQMRKQIEQLIELHAARVEQYKLVLDCEAAVVEAEIRSGVDDIWNVVIS